MEIHATEQLNAELRIIALFAPVQLAMLEIHSLDASLNRRPQNQNVLTITNAHRPRHVSIKFAEIHVQNVIHAVKMPNVELFNTIQHAIVHQDGQAIHKFNATNVSIQVSLYYL